VQIATEAQVYLEAQTREAGITTELTRATGEE
jgi:hypothetical protein